MASRARPHRTGARARARQTLVVRLQRMPGPRRPGEAVQAAPARERDRRDDDVGVSARPRGIDERADRPPPAGGVLPGARVSWVTPVTLTGTRVRMEPL